MKCSETCSSIASDHFRVPDNPQMFVDKVGLKPIFGLFMGARLSRKPAEIAEDEERICTIVRSKEVQKSRTQSRIRHRSLLVKRITTADLCPTSFSPSKNEQAHQNGSLIDRSNLTNGLHFTHLNESTWAISGQKNLLLDQIDWHRLAFRQHHRRTLFTQ